MITVSTVTIKDNPPVGTAMINDNKKRINKTKIQTSASTPISIIKLLREWFFKSPRYKSCVGKSSFAISGKATPFFF